MTAQEWTFPEPDLLAALDNLGIRIPHRVLLPAEHRAHEAAFEITPPELEPPDDVTLQRRNDAWLERTYR